MPSVQINGKRDYPSSVKMMPEHGPLVHLCFLLEQIMFQAPAGSVHVNSLSAANPKVGFAPGL